MRWSRYDPRVLPNQLLKSHFNSHEHVHRVPCTRNNTIMWICFVYFNWNTTKLYYGLNSAIVTAVAEYAYIMYIILFTTNNYIYLIYVLKFHTIVSVDNDRTVYILFYFIPLLINTILRKLLIQSQSWARTKIKTHLSSSYST